MSPPREICRCRCVCVTAANLEPVGNKNEIMDKKNLSLIYEMRRCFVSGQFDSKRTMLISPNKGTYQIHDIHYNIYNIIYYCLLLPSDETEYEYSGSEEEEEEASEQEGEPR